MALGNKILLWRRVKLAIFSALPALMLQCVQRVLSIQTEMILTMMIRVRIYFKIILYRCADGFFE